MITGEKLMIYLGVALMLLGTYIILGDALSTTPTVVAALGGFIFSIGLIMAYVGFKGKDKVEIPSTDSDFIEKHALGPGGRH